MHAHYVTAHYVASCRGAGLGRPDGMPGLPDWSAEASLDERASVVTLHPTSPPGWERTALGRPLPTLAHRVAGMSLLTGAPADLPAILGGLYYDLAGAALPVALDGLLAVAGPDRLLYGSDFPFTPAAAGEHLAAGLRRAPALRGARLGVEPGTPAAALFPRLIGVDR